MSSKRWIICCLLTFCRDCSRSAIHTSTILPSLTRSLVCCLLTVVCCLSEVHAQSRLKKIWTKADSILTDRYYKTSYDTNYVVRPEGRLTLKLKGNQAGYSLRSKGTVNSLRFKSHLSTNHKTTISIGAAYRGLSAAYSINPAKLRGFYDDYELSFNYYASRFCVDATYQRSSSLSGNMHYGDETYRMESGDTKLKVFNITAYYIFNHRRYSVAAPFSQSYIQRHSAGSWLAGISYQGGSIKATEEGLEKIEEERAKSGEPATSEETDGERFRIGVGHLGIGGGYGYNLVLGRKWLLHLSLVPTFVIYNRNNITVDGERIKVSHLRYDMLFNERAAVVYNFSPRYFAGINALANNSLFGGKHVTFHQSKWAAHAFVGMRLWK